MYAVKLMSNPPQQVQPSTNLAILEIVCILVGNIFAVVVGILALVFYNDIQVKGYFAQLNGTITSAESVAPAPPVPVSEMGPAPVQPEDMASAEEEAPKRETDL
jgi:hypothetical protein